MSRLAKKQITFYFFIISLAILACMFIIISSKISNDKLQVIDEKSIMSKSLLRTELETDNICLPLFYQYDMNINTPTTKSLIDVNSNEFDCKIPFSYLVFISILFNIAINCKKFMKMGSL